MIDILSGGRLKLGVRDGELPRRVPALRANPKTQVSRFEEAIDIVRRAWAGEQIDHEGKHFNIKGHITPLPGRPSCGSGAMSDAGVRRAARFGAPGRPTRSTTST